MKTNSKMIFAMMLMMLAASCRNKDDRMLTIVNEDGTCSREYTFHTSQQWLAATPDEDYDSIVDKSWERSWSVIGADSMRYPVPLTEAQLDSMQALDNSQPLGNMLMVHCRKTYGSVEEMSAHLYRADGSHLVEVKGIKANSKLEKRFKWFYTDYTFSETFTYKGEPVFPVPISRFLARRQRLGLHRDAAGHPACRRQLVLSEEAKIGRREICQRVFFIFFPFWMSQNGLFCVYRVNNAQE